MGNLAVQADVLNDEIDKLAARLGRRDLTILETGSIRSSDEDDRIGYGWSTLTFAAHVKKNGGRTTSVDLDTSEAAKALTNKKLGGWASLVESDSIVFLDSLVGAEKSFDLIFLDSASDPVHILREWDRAVKLVRSPSVIIIDDVQHDEDTCGTKGSLVIERLNAAGMTFRCLKRWTGHAWIGMLAIDF